MNGVELRVKGKVQGVGFRPFVWQLAHRLSLTGEVLNDGQGVLIRFFLDTSEDEKEAKQNIDLFQQNLIQELPPLAQIETISCRDYRWVYKPKRFSIVQSQTTNIDTQVVPDAATCPECLKELLTPVDPVSHSQDQKLSVDRRFLYPFINCTHCGPRFTIIKGLPYDRPKTVMADFPMCPECEEEYKDPADRRYHAQPVACPKCGPLAIATLADGIAISGNWLELALNAIKQGDIVAIKSVGGFHLACDASNAKAVQKLRNRKHRQQKPFALMASSTDLVHEIAHLNEQQSQVLQSSMAPIVLLNKKETTKLAANVAPYLSEIGVMLPSNPIQHLLAYHYPKPLVMTSGNKTGLPPALTNELACSDLVDLADLFILHNRDIVQRCDDSLVRVSPQGELETLRRSRGLVPDTINLPEGFPDATGFIAYGGDLKNAFAIGKGKQIIVSQYLGDLANIETQHQYKNAISHFTDLYKVEVNHHVADLHPGYFSHQFAQNQQGQHSLVQHHHAHIASCLVENQWPANGGKVLALAMDGLGMGENGELWGAELMVADYYSYLRLGGIPAIPLVGGDLAAKSPWRSYYAHLKTFYPHLGSKHLNSMFEGKPIATLNTATAKGINCHQVRSAGRMFDAIAASLSISFDEIEYEGAAACQLEALAHQWCGPKPKPIAITHNQFEIDLTEFWPVFLAYQGSREEKAYLFHISLANALVELAIDAQKKYPETSHLVLTGGVFHNRLLAQLVQAGVQDKLSILQHKLFSCGDGGLALGQLAVALMKTEKPTLN